MRAAGEIDREQEPRVDQLLCSRVLQLCGGAGSRFVGDAQAAHAARWAEGGDRRAASR